MSFRNDAQIAIVCQLLCARLGKGQLWDAKGMTDAGAALHERIGVLSHGEQIVFKVALSVWNSFDNPGPTFSELWAVLDGDHLQRVGSLLVALSNGDADLVDQWIQDQQDEAERQSAPV